MEWTHSRILGYDTPPLLLIRQKIILLVFVNTGNILFNIIIYPISMDLLASYQQCYQKANMSAIVKAKCSKILLLPYICAF